MQRPPTVQQTPTRPHANAAAALAAASSPFASHRNAGPPGMTAGQGQGPSGSGSGSGGVGGGINSATPGGSGFGSAPRGGSFNNDDFPALGAQQQAPPQPQPSHFANGTHAQAAVAAAAAAAAAEQASAAAALQHQASQREAHRLGMLNGGGGAAAAAASSSSSRGGASALSAARGGFGDLDRNYANKLGGPQVSGLPALSSTNAGGAQAWGATASGGGDHNAATTNGTAAGSAPPSVTTPASQILFSSVDRFGLAGLLRIIKLQASGLGAGGAAGANPEDVGLLSLGNDLQSLGLDVSAEGPLHADFHTPWSSDAHPLQRQQRAMVEPEFHLPSCYNVQPPPPAQNKVANFSDETLFFIFYSTPRDMLQEVAAMELHHRNWRFHKELQLWLTKEHNMEPTQKTPMYEKGQYVFWDVDSWQRVTKNFVLLYELLEDRPSLVAQQQQLLQQQQQQQQAANAAGGPSTTPGVNHANAAAGGGAPTAPTAQAA